MGSVVSMGSSVFFLIRRYDNLHPAGRAIALRNAHGRAWAVIRNCNFVGSGSLWQGTHNQGCWGSCASLLTCAALAALVPHSLSCMYAVRDALLIGVTSQGLLMPARANRKCNLSGPTADRSTAHVRPWQPDRTFVRRRTVACARWA